MSSIIKSGTGIALYPGGAYYSETEASFEVGDSPKTIDFVDELGKEASSGYIKNDGAGNIQLELKKRGITAFGSEIVLKQNETFDLKGRDVAEVKLTHVADSSYRIYAE